MTNLSKRKSFIIHKDSIEILDKLFDEQAGKLFKAIKFYQKNNEIPKLDITLDLVFTPFLNQFIRDDELYIKTCQARKDAGSKGGKQKVANASKSKQKVANLADSESKSDSKNKNESEIKKEILPDFIDEKTFQDYVDMRIKIKKPMTDIAKKLIIKKLTQFENKVKGNANIALDNATMAGWQGVFEPKQENNKNQQPNKTNFLAYDPNTDYSKDGGFYD